MDCPSGKVRYASKSAARRAMRRWAKRLTPYICPECRSWHVTSTERR